VSFVILSLKKFLSLIKKPEVFVPPLAGVQVKYKNKDTVLTQNLNFTKV